MAGFTYLTAAQLQARVREATRYSSTVLTALIEEEAALVNSRLGTPPADSMVEYLYEPGMIMWLAYSAASPLTEIMDLVAGVSIDLSTVILDGRAVYRKVSSASSSSWFANPDIDTFPHRREELPVRCKVTYALADSPKTLGIIRGVMIDLCRLALTDMGGEQSETLGDHAHTSKDVEAERSKTLARLNGVRRAAPQIT